MEAKSLRQKFKAKLKPKSLGVKKEKASISDTEAFSQVKKGFI